MKTLGERIKKIRKKLDLSQSAFSDKIGVSKDYPEGICVELVSAWELNKSKPKVETLMKIAELGDINIKCAVLEDGTRVLSRIDVLRSIGRTGSAKGGRAYDQEFKTPVFLTANNLKPFITKELRENSDPIFFKPNG